MSSNDYPYFVGVDLGGTNMKIGVMDNHGKTLEYISIPTLVERGPEDAVKRMAAGIHEAVKNAGLTPKDIARVGLGSPGTMDIPAGMLVRPSNLPGWNFFPIRDKLAEESGFGVTFANDATAAAFAEYWVGAGKGEVVSQTDEFLMITTEAMNYKKNGTKHPLLDEALDDDFAVDYVRVYDIVENGWRPDVKAALDGIVERNRGNRDAYAVFDFDCQ